MPITKNGSGQIEYTPKSDRFETDTTGVHPTDSIQICDNVDQLKQLGFDTSAQATNSSVIIKTKNPVENSTVTITLPSQSVTLGGTLGYLYGNGEDGTATISSSTSFSRSMYYTNLTISPGISVNMQGYRLFVSGTLTIGAGATLWRSPNGGGNASGATGGSAAASIASVELGGAGGGAAGASGTTGAGAQGGSNANLSTCMGSSGGNGGAGGNSGSTQGGVFRAGSTATYRPFLLPMANCLSGATIITGGAGGGGGSSGAGDGSFSGGGGGGSGGGGNIVMIYARIINNAGTISARGGHAGNGAAGLGGNAAGGGGGGGGGGGCVMLVYDELINTGTITAAGGNGGAGGIGSGTGQNGYAGSNGVDGKIIKFNAALGQYE